MHIIGTMLGNVHAQSNMSTRQVAEHPLPGLQLSSKPHKPVHKRSSSPKTGAERTPNYSRTPAPHEVTSTL
jgi:hypothetical protein